MAGNQQIVDFLRHYLKEAETNPYESIAITMVGKDGRSPYGGYGGNVALQYFLLESITHIGGQIRQAMENWILPPRNPLLSTGFFVYSMLTCPLGFDFLVWLMSAKMYHRRFRGEGPLQVCFWEGRKPDEIPSREQRVQLLNNVFRPLLKLAGGVEIEDPHGCYRENYVIKDIVLAARDGEEVPKLLSSCKSRFPGHVTITLREAAHLTHRNSRIEDWCRFASYLRTMGEKVVFVRDTLKANEPFFDFETCPEASLNIDDRMAIYAEAKMNFFVSNGPVTMAVFSDAPWMQFVTLTDEDNATKFWQENNAMEPGDQYPWANANQRIVWQTDTYENLVAAWDSLQLADAA